MKLAGSVLEELWFAEPADEDEDAKASESMAAKLGELGGLKPFPVVAQRVMSLLNKPDFRVAEVSAALEEDPSLAAGMLRVANSAFFAGAKNCASISQAFVRMGMMAVKESILSVAMMDMFPDTDGLGKRIRDHCAATAAIVQTLARDFDSRYVEGIFLAGLMHDVGKLLLMESGELIYDTGNVEETLAPDRIHLEERAALGYDHAVLAGHVLRAWKIPEPVPKVVAWHHQASRAYEEPRIGAMVAMLRISDNLEWAFSYAPDTLDEVVDTLAKGSDCAFAGIEGRELGAMIEKLYHVRADALSMFGG